MTFRDVHPHTYQRIYHQYTNICNLTAGKDNRTYDLSLSILHEEIQHESWISEFLGEGASGHFKRKGENSPYVSKFLK